MTLAILNLSVSMLCLPSSFSSIGLTVWEQMSFEDLGYQNGRILAILNLCLTVMPPLGYQNGRILAILNLCLTVMPPIQFWLNKTYGLGDVVYRNSRWHHLGYRNGTILAILNLCVTVMPPIKFWLNLN